MNSDKLKKKIQEDKINLYKLSRESGIPYATLHDIVSGKTKNPTVDTILKLAKTLEESVESII